MAKDSRHFNYQRRTAEDVRERANQSTGDFDTLTDPRIPVFKPKDGKNTVRILPPTWPDARHFGLDVYVNYGIGVDNQSYISLSKMKGEKDPLEEAKRDAGKDGDAETASALTPRKRVGIYLIDRNAEEEGPQVWLTPPTFDKTVINLCYDEDTKEIIEIDHPEKGHDLRFYKEGTGLKTKYDPSRMKILGESPISDRDDEMDEWLEYIEKNPIPEILVFHSYDHISMAYNGVVRLRDKDDKDKDDKDDRRGGGRSSGRGDREERPASRRTRDPDPDPEERPSRGRDRDREEAPARDSRDRDRGRSRDPDPDPEPEPEERTSRRDRDDDHRGRDRGKERDPEPERDPDDEQPTSRERDRERERERDPEPDTSRRRTRLDDDKRDTKKDEKPERSIRDKLADRRRSSES